MSRRARESPRHDVARGGAEPPGTEREEVRACAQPCPEPSPWSPSWRPPSPPCRRSPPAGRAPPADLGERTLERGDRGDDVRQLQELLTDLDLRTGADGTFGADTVAHVKTYERREDLPVAGRASPGEARGMQRRAGAADAPLRPTDPVASGPADPAAPAAD